MPVRPRGASFEASIVHGKTRLRRSFPTPDAAALWEAETRARLLRGEAVEAPEGSPASGAPRTLQDLLDRTYERRWAGSRSEGTALRNATAVVKFLGPSRPPAGVDVGDVDALVAHLKDRSQSNATINRKLAALSTMLRFAAERGWITRAPKIEKLRESVGRVRWLTPEEEQKVLDWLAWAGRKDLADLVVVLADTGLRLGEALRLRWSDVDLGDRPALRVWETKGDLPRSVPLTKRARSVLEARPRGDLVFGGDLDGFSAARQWAQMREALGLGRDEQFVLHALRHTCASRLIQRGVDLLTVKAWLGHKTLSVTMRYAHLAPNHLQTALQALESSAA